MYDTNLDSIVTAQNALQVPRVVIFSVWRAFVLRSWNMNPLATTYDIPAKIWVQRYSLVEEDRLSFNAIPSETEQYCQLEHLGVKEVKRQNLLIAGIITATHDRDNSDCKFFIPATSTQSGPIVCVSGYISACTVYSWEESGDPTYHPEDPNDSPADNGKE